jgi:hypothetical protein
MALLPRFFYNTYYETYANDSFLLDEPIKSRCNINLLSLSLLLSLKIQNKIKIEIEKLRLFRLSAGPYVDALYVKST